MQVNKQELEPDMEQQIGSKLGKEYIKAVYCHPVYLTSKQSASCKMPGWIKFKLESRFPGELSNTSDTQMMPSLWQKLKSLLMRVKEESKKSGSEFYIQKMKIIASGHITSWQTGGEKMEIVTDFISWSPESLWMVTAAMKLTDACSLEEEL